MSKQVIPTLQDDTLDFLFAYMHGQAARQIERADQLDAKGTQLFAAASVVVGLAGLAAAGSAPVVTGALIAVIAFYIATGVTAYFMLRVRSWRVSGHADVLWEQHWMDTPNEIKHAIVEDAAASVKENRDPLASKARWLKAMQVLLSLEVACVGIAAILSRLVEV